MASPVTLGGKVTPRAWAATKGLLGKEMLPPLFAMNMCTEQPFESQFSVAKKRGQEASLTPPLLQQPIADGHCPRIVYFYHPHAAIPVNCCFDLCQRWSWGCCPACAGYGKGQVREGEMPLCSSANSAPLSPP